MTKIEFLDIYNPTKSIEEALFKSINAAVQRNRIYVKGISNKNKKDIRRFWKQKLVLLAEKYKKHNWSIDTHNKEIVKLKLEMNDKFKDLIDFRISHSQKSISVYFKHLWCMNDFPIPCQCPVDRRILTRLKVPYKERSWGYINEISIHKEKIDLIKERSLKDGYDTISEWELCNFNIS